MALMGVAAFGASSMSAGIRFASAELHSFEIAFFRNLIGIFVLAPTALRRGLMVTLATRRIGLHAVRGVLNALAMLCYFYALTVTPLATAAALGFTAPLFATLLAIPILGERVGIRRWVGMALGFAGTLIVLRPGFEALTIGVVLLLVSSLLWAGALVIIKILARTEGSLTITLYASLFLTPITGAFALFDWRWPSMDMMLVLLGISILGTITQISIAQAFHEAEASLVLPVDFTKLLWASLLGYVFFDESPDPLAIVGGAVILFAVIYIAYREAASGKAPISEQRTAGVSHPTRD